MVRVDRGRGQRRTLTLMMGLLAAAFLLPCVCWVAIPRAHAQDSAVIGRVVRDFAAVHTGPGPHHAVIWRLYAGSQVAIIGETLDASGALWYRIRLWNSEEGWIEAAAVSFDLSSLPWDAVIDRRTLTGYALPGREQGVHRQGRNGGG
ncbi:MAG TPA: SH3 domain-containing protein [Chloroflexota bacterium]|nr:SH3 domain-containing protein [Chloroflexota bacterium]